MGRIKLKLPEKKIFSCTIPVRITDVNYGNHVGNDSLVSILHEARVQLLKHFHFTELNAGGTSLIMGDLAIEYKKEGFYGDLFTVSIFPGDITRVSFELYYEVKTDRNGEPTLIAIAKTGLICYDYQNQKVNTIPEALKAALT